MPFPGGSFAVLRASGGCTDEATTAIVDQIAGQITAVFEVFLDSERKRLLNTLPALNAQMVVQQGQIASIIGELSPVTQQLNNQIPGVEGAQATASATLEALSKRDQEVFDKLKESFANVEARLIEVKVQSEGTSSAQRYVHTVVARQKSGLDNVRLEVGKYVTETLASVHAQATSGGGGNGNGSALREREAPQLNDPKKKRGRRAVRQHE